jgi:hypothetical protein
VQSPPILRGYASLRRGIESVSQEPKVVGATFRAIPEWSTKPWGVTMTDLSRRTTSDEGEGATSGRPPGLVSLKASGGPRHRRGKRALTGVVTAGLLLAAGTNVLVSGSAHGATLVPGAVNHPVTVGPISGENGFPVSYTDGSKPTAARLEGCLDGNDPLCTLAADPGYDPTKPTSFPDNFPEEFFYQRASAVITTGNGGKATLDDNLEGAFANGPVVDGDQIVFGRFRIKITNAVPNASYVVTHPYGTDTVKANAAGLVFVTQDVGLTAGNFTTALSSRIGPFLTWDVAAPAGYIGDPTVNHTVTGSPFLDGSGAPQNYLRIDGPGIGGPGVDTVSTKQFSLLGKRATNTGVEPSAATYSRSAAGVGTVDVYATSGPDQGITVSGSGFDRTTMLGDGKNYYARVPLTGVPPKTVTLTNAGDKPATVKTAPVVDAVDIAAAVYDPTARTLAVTAASSDKATPPTLTAVGYGPLAAGTTTFDNVSAPPLTLTVTSTAGGTDTDTVRGSGAALAPIAVQAFAGADATVQQGQDVTLDGSASTGDVATYSWTQVGGTPVAITGADTAKPTFSAPTTAGALSFELTVTGPGGPSKDRVDLTVADITAPVANAGSDQTVVRGTAVKLNGAASAGAATYKWTQAAGDPVVTLTGASTATPSFTFPATAKPLTFTLTVTGSDGTSSKDDVIVTPKPDPLTVTARYRTGTRQWIITGTATLLSPANTVTVHVGSTLSGAVIGTPAAVDAATGAWTVKISGSTVAPDANRTISLESKLGGVLLAAPVNVTT